MASITTWNRLSPKQRSKDIEHGLQARIHDPLWMLSRQWQFGEFLGEDGGSPIKVEAEISTTKLNKYLPGEFGQENNKFQNYDSNKLPLEVMVERDNNDLAKINYRKAAEKGNNFLHELAVLIEDENEFLNVKRLFIEQYGFLYIEDEMYDEESIRFLKLLIGRAIDGCKLYVESQNTDAFNIEGVDPNTSRLVEKAIESWLAKILPEEYDSDVAAAWQANRMEYTFSVAGPNFGDTNENLIFEAKEYHGGHLDWPSFVYRPDLVLGTDTNDHVVKETKLHSGIPTSLDFPGMPAARWWEFEDARVDLGDIKTAPQDLSRLLLMEFALLYGNNWFLIPIDLEIGSIAKVKRLEVTNTFGETIEVSSSESVNSQNRWRMFKISDSNEANNNVLPGLFLPPALGVSLHGDPIEEVLLIRDEMANNAWAVEKKIERKTGTIADRHEIYHEKRNLMPNEGMDKNSDTLKYTLSTEVPDFWMPLIPVQEAAGERMFGFKLGGVKREVYSAAEPQGELLKELGNGVLAEEEIPRAGVGIIRQAQYVRWIDGSIHIWTGKHKRSGRGEGSSGLRFDFLSNE